MLQHIYEGGTTEYNTGFSVYNERYDITNKKISDHQTDIKKPSNGCLKESSQI
jgi:hypothetical protein